ncbi:hypothetical protein WOLCODRAFT_164008 [Wolfiporia cocos MD-104 SS10]|uniref:Uncharacterized protein n=1 Tax=Wolfiporia cocos (strain MD-104) TaxID=742152 RepID=A0A2H3JKP1_WOLCO|nr:hypothetical protein WOLCODRAFT_164008 [Wolfiporia cocos MD-104 SS10]
MTILCFNAYSALRAWYVRTMEADLQQENPSESCTNPGQFYDYIFLSVYEHATTTDTQAARDTVKDIDALMLSIGAKYPRAPWTVLQTIPFRCRISPYLNLTAIGSMLQHRPMNCPKFLLNYNDPMTKYIRDLPWSNILVMFKFMHCLAYYIRIERVKEKTLGEVAEEISVAFEKYWRILGGDTLDQLGNVVEDGRDGRKASHTSTQLTVGLP